jgi:hypothetical protein
VERTPYQLTAEALADNRVLDLLLGNDPFAYRTRHTQHTGPTDVFAIYSCGIRIYAQDHPEAEVAKVLAEILLSLCRSVLGIQTAADVIYLESAARTRSDFKLDIDMDVWASAVREAIRELEPQIGKSRLIDLANLSYHTVQHGGPRFV